MPDDSGVIDKIKKLGGIAPSSKQLIKKFPEKIRARLHIWKKSCNFAARKKWVYT